MPKTVLQGMRFEKHLTNSIFVSERYPCVIDFLMLNWKVIIDVPFDVQIIPIINLTSNM